MRKLAGAVQGGQAVRLGFAVCYGVGLGLHICSVLQRKCPHVARRKGHNRAAFAVDLHRVALFTLLACKPLRALRPCFPLRAGVPLRPPFAARPLHHAKLLPACMRGIPHKNRSGACWPNCPGVTLLPGGLRLLQRLKRFIPSQYGEAAPIRAVCAWNTLDSRNPLRAGFSLWALRPRFARVALVPLDAVNHRHAVLILHHKVREL